MRANSEPFQFKAVGVEKGRGSEWIFVFDVGPRVERIRQGYLVIPSTILGLDPDADRWRAMFPHPARIAKFDALAAGAFLMRECWAAQLRREAQAAPAAAE